MSEPFDIPHDAPCDAELQSALESLDARIGDALGIPITDRAFGVLDLRGERLAMIRGDVQFYGASVPKIAIVLAYLELCVDDVDRLPPQVAHELGRVLKCSDNDLAAKYSRIVGLERIQALLQTARYRFYDRNHGGGIWCGKHYGIDTPRVGDPLDDHSHAVTVRQCLRYYLMLEQGRLGGPRVSARLRELFASQWLEAHDDNFVAGLRGRDVTILRKNGLWEDWHLDTARVEHGGRVVLVAGATHHARGREYLSRMAAGVDELLCGPAVTRPFVHHTLMWTDGSHDSPIVESPIKFNEAIASWNLACPAGQGAVVELRVGRRDAGEWSPWLHVGAWGDAPPGGERTAKFESGRIDVDYFRSEERWDRAQLRVRATPNVRVERLALCLSDMTGKPDSFRPIPPNRDASLPEQSLWRRRLAVPYRSQKVEPAELAGRICSPTSVAMVLDFRGVARSTLDVCRACLDPGSNLYGNWPQNVQAAFSFGVPGYLTRIADWRDVQRFIARDQPLIISVRVDQPGALRGAPYQTTDGHLLVLCGFDGDERVFVNDPAARDASTGMTSYSRGDLETCWMHASGGLCYVLLPRDAAPEGR